MASSNKRAILYLHVDKSTKKWLQDLCKQQIGFVPVSTIAERIFVAAKKDPSILKAAIGEKPNEAKV